MTKTHGQNIEITEHEARAIRDLDDFDLAMLLSEVRDHGRSVARQTLRFIALSERGVKKPDA